MGSEVSPRRKQISPRGYQELNDRGIVAVRFPPRQDRGQLYAVRKESLAKRGRSK
jgi:hypothetical protein